MSPHLDFLTNKFNNLLIEYQEISKKYSDAIDNNDNSLIQVNDFAFLGKNNYKVLGNSNISDCESTCNKNNQCSGATFNSKLNDCILYNGVDKMFKSKISVAIVRKVYYYGIRLKEINDELIDLNERIEDISIKKNNKYSKNEMIMIHNNDNLFKDREKINDILNQFKTLNTAYEEGNIIVNANYMKYIIFLIILIFLVILLLRNTVSTTQSGGGNKMIYNKNILIIIFCVIIIFTFTKYFY